MFLEKFPPETSITAPHNVAIELLLLSTNQEKHYIYLKQTLFQMHKTTVRQIEGLKNGTIIKYYVF